MVTESGWQGFFVHVHDAAETMQDDWEVRHVPSPSSVNSCRLRQWFQGVGYEKSNRIPVDSIKKMESGTVIENFWREVYTRAGFLVSSPMPPVEIGTMKSRGGDGMLFVETEACSKAIGLPIGSSLLLELKDFGAWSYMDFIDKGIKVASPDYYAQVQSYLHAYKRDYCIFHAGMADASGTKFIWKRIRKHDDEIPPFWIEIIKREPAVVMQTLGRASEISWAVENIRDRVPIELRDYESVKLVREHKYPCGWCGYADACVQAVTGGHSANILTNESSSEPSGQPEEAVGDTAVQSEHAPPSGE